MNLQILSEHSVDVSLLTPGGFVLDAGCRDFSFSMEMVARYMNVVALDPDPEVKDPHMENLRFHHAALIADKGKGQAKFKLTADPQARHLSESGDIEVSTIDIVTLAAMSSVGIWDVVKLDIEGSEYGVLRSWPGSISKQISVEFHDHIEKRSDSCYQEILKHLGQWYTPMSHERSKRHCLPENFWDSLFILRELA